MMTASAIVMMIIGIVLLWGGLAASIFNAVKKSKRTA
ncbi:methionine/alanine import family NSS transporter small subunit [Jeotgalibacillus sp. ET6]|nr:methionine/alanine import family NSS transporter small subunit [Jeotgalibacillus sp. ET6]MDG5471763.1 methionine/alanine import family NSS transporter small subunit [Jeotgalibacillus sp. ET6]